MQLSIIVPVYNMAADNKLKFCLDSLVAQTISDYEILAVDDASTDDSLAILREYESRYTGLVKVFTYPDNRRQGGAKNVGLSAASGEWVGFVDSDDWIAPDFYEKLLGKARETGADLVGCDYSLVTGQCFTPGKIVVNNTKEQTGVLDHDKHGSLIMRSGSMVVKLYKTSVIRENHLDFPEKVFYEDNCAGPVWSLYFKHFERIEEPMYFYYQHGGSTVHLVTEEKCRDRMQVGRQLFSEMEKRGFLEEYRKEIEYRFTELYFVNTVFTYMQGVSSPKLSFVKELRKGQLEIFPGFRENSYYREYTGPEEQKLIDLLMKSPLRFYVFYRAKLFVRKMR